MLNPNSHNLADAPYNSEFGQAVHIGSFIVLRNNCVEGLDEILVYVGML